MKQIEEVVWRRLQAVRVETLPTYQGPFFGFSEKAEPGQWYRWYGLKTCQFMLLAHFEANGLQFLVTTAFKRNRIYLAVTGGDIPAQEILSVEIVRSVNVKVVDADSFNQIRGKLIDLLQQV